MCVCDYKKNSPLENMTIRNFENIIVVRFKNIVVGNLKNIAAGNEYRKNKEILKKE